VEKDRSRACNARASSTAFIDKDGHLHVYCHEKTLSAPGEGDSGDFAEYWLIARAVAVVRRARLGPDHS
jgi:hypothetical protein